MFLPAATANRPEIALPNPMVQMKIFAVAALTVSA
jgi:hypothetical protein